MPYLGKITSKLTDHIRRGSWQMLRLLAVAVLFLAQSSCADAKTLLHLKADGQIARNGDWVAGCDNIGRCTAIGIPRAHSKTRSHNDMPYEMGIIYLTEGSAGSIGTVEIFPANDVIIDSVELFRIADLPDDRGRHFRYLFDRTILPSESAFELVETLKSEKPIRGINDNSGDVRVRFPGSGFAALFNAIEKHQKSTRAAPIEGEERPQNKLRPVAASLGRGHDELRAIRDKLPCDPDKFGIAPETYVLSGGAVLSGVRCYGLNRNAKSYWYEVDGRSDGSVQLFLPDPRKGIFTTASDGLSNSSFDPVTGILQSIEFAGPDGDCGNIRRWATTRAGWLMLDRREMPVCGSRLEPTDWIRTYRSEIVEEGSVG